MNQTDYNYLWFGCTPKPSHPTQAPSQHCVAGSLGQKKDPAEYVVTLQSV